MQTAQPDSGAATERPTGFISPDRRFAGWLATQKAMPPSGDTARVSPGVAIPIAEPDVVDVGQVDAALPA
jgi:hypothetical protein